jgi:hypothetical protein
MFDIWCSTPRSVNLLTSRSVQLSQLGECEDEILSRQCIICLTSRMLVARDDGEKSNRSDVSEIMHISFILRGSVRAELLTQSSFGRGCSLAPIRQTLDKLSSTK